MKSFAEKLKSMLEIRKQMLETKKRNNDGFTLLELLVVVAILAAIAGTATIALQDTDARAAAAAHVAMMDELNKGVNTFRVLQKNVYPDNLDSLLYTTNDDSSTGTLLPNGTIAADGDIFGVEDSINAGTIINGAEIVMADIGMKHLRYIDNAPDAADLPDDVDATGCTPLGGNLQKTVASRSNNVVAGNIFNGKEGNGCGYSDELTDTSKVAYWVGAVERILGPGEYGDAHYNAVSGAMVSTDATVGAVAPVLMAAGFGPSSNLFNTKELGGMTSVPVYRHVTKDQYNRFIGLFQIGTATATAANAWTVEPVDQVAFVGVVDGAGDTKEEELGEWDGSRNTI